LNAYSYKLHAQNHTHKIYACITYDTYITYMLCKYILYDITELSLYCCQKFIKKYLVSTA